MEKKVIMYDSPEAATYVKDIEGWVNAERRFFGKGKDAEHLARYSSSTHIKCECGEIISRDYSRCEKCRREAAAKKYAEYPYKEWDGKEPVCTSDGDTYFFNEEALIDYMVEQKETSINLLICDPIHYQPIDGETVASDCHEDWEPCTKLEAAMKAFNELLASLPPHSWTPSKIRTHYVLAEQD